MEEINRPSTFQPSASQVKEVIGHEFIRGQSIIVPNLLTIFQRLAYSMRAPSLTSLDQIFVFSMPAFANENPMQLQDYANLDRLKLLLYEKSSRQRTSIGRLPKQRASHLTYTILFAIENSRTGSVLTFFTKLGKTTAIKHRRTEAACSISQHHFAMVVTVMEIRKFVIVEQSQTELDPLYELPLDNPKSEWFELRLLQLKSQRFVLLFLGGQHCPTNVIIFWLNDDCIPKKVTKKSGICDHGRIQPLLLHRNNPYGYDGFFVVGGRKHSKANKKECLLNYEYYRTTTLLDASAMKEGHVQGQLSNANNELTQCLWNGAQLQSYLILPSSKKLYEWSSADNGQNLEIRDTQLRHSIGRKCTHERIRFHELELGQQCDDEVRFSHVCRQATGQALVPCGAKTKTKCQRTFEKLRKCCCL